MKTSALILIAAMLITPIAAIISTTTVSAEHTASVSADVSSVNKSVTKVINVTVSNTSGDDIGAVKITLPVGKNFASPSALQKVLKDNLVMPASNNLGDSAGNENKVWLPAGTMIVLLENENFLLPENSEIIISKEDNIYYPDSAATYKLSDNLRVQVTEDVWLVENNLPMWGDDNWSHNVASGTAHENENLLVVNPFQIQLGSGLDSEANGDNRLRLLADTPVIYISENEVQLPENVQFYVYTDNNDNRLDINKTAEVGFDNFVQDGTGTIENTLKTQNDIPAVLSTNSNEEANFDNFSAPFRTVNAASVYGGYSVPAGATVWGIENNVYIPAGTILQVTGAPKVRIPENTIVYLENGENISVADQDEGLNLGNPHANVDPANRATVDNQPDNNWELYSSATTAEWRSEDNTTERATVIDAGENMVFPFKVFTDSNDGTYTFTVTTTDVNGLSKNWGFNIDVDSTFKAPEIHVDPVWVGENGTVTIQVKAEEAFSFDNLIVVENINSEIPENYTVQLKDNATSSDNKTWTVTYTTTDLGDNEGGYAQVILLGAKDALNNENNVTSEKAFFVDRVGPEAIVLWDYSFPQRFIDNIDDPAGGAYRVVENKNTFAISATVTMDADNVYFTDASTVATAENSPENIKLYVVVDNGTPVLAATSDATGLLSYSLVLSDGSHTVSAYLVDRAGNVGLDNYENVVIDTSAPTITFVSPTSGQSLQDNKITIKVTLSDVGLGIENENLDLEMWGMWDNTWNGFRVDILDKDGTQVLFTSENGLDMVNFPDNDPFTSFTFENTFDNGNGFEDATYMLRVSAGDNLFVTQENILFTVDVGAPSVPASVVGSQTAGTSSASPTNTKVSTVSLTGTGEVAATITLFYTIDGGVTWTATGTTATVGSDGTWTIASYSLPEAGKTIGLSVTATDAAGNESGRTLFGYLRYDASAPTVAFTSPSEGTTTDAMTIPISGTVTKDSWESFSDLTLTIQSGLSSVNIPITAGTGDQGSFAYSISLSEGVNTIVATVTDTLGNAGTAATVSVTRTVTSFATYAIVVVIIALILAAIAIFKK